MKLDAGITQRSHERGPKGELDQEGHQRNQIECPTNQDKSKQPQHAELKCLQVGIYVLIVGNNITAKRQRPNFGEGTNKLLEKNGNLAMPLPGTVQRTNTVDDYCKRVIAKKRKA